MLKGYKTKEAKDNILTVSQRLASTQGRKTHSLADKRNEGGHTVTK